MKKVLSSITLACSIASCATLVNSNRQQVYFRGGAENGLTKVSTPDGTFDVENGSGSFMMSRSKGNIPIRITCPTGESKNEIIETKFDWLKGGVGNILTYGMGWFVDPFVDNAYTISDVSLMGKCKNQATPTVAH